MKKRFSAVLVTGLFLLTMTGMANAALTTIGTATYDDGTGSKNYNLIYDDNNNGNSIVWLDYTKVYDVWTAHKTWAAGLDSNLTYNLNSGYSVAWTDTAWRLPSTLDGFYSDGDDGTTTAGYNITTSEMGHLYYTELGNRVYLDFGIEDFPSRFGGLNNTGDFDRLFVPWYWSGTEYADNPDDAWVFLMYAGRQYKLNKISNGFGLAVRSGQVSAVPIPGAIWLLGSGLAGVVALGRRRKGNRV